LTTEFSYHEFVNCYVHFRSKFKEQLIKPTPDNNYLINYDSQLKNLLITHGTFHMIQAGLGCFAVKHFLGGALDEKAFKYLGETKGRYAQIALYVGMFFMAQSFFRQQKSIDVNHVLNVRETQGEIMVGIIMQTYPHKVDHRKMRELMEQKSQYNLMQLHRFQEIVGAGDGSQHQAPIRVKDGEQSLESMLEQYNKGQTSQAPQSSTHRALQQSHAQPPSQPMQSQNDAKFEQKLIKMNEVQQQHKEDVQERYPDGPAAQAKNKEGAERPSLAQVQQRTID